MSVVKHAEKLLVSNIASFYLKADFDEIFIHLEMVWVLFLLLFKQFLTVGLFHPLVEVQNGFGKVVDKFPV